MRIDVHVYHHLVTTDSQTSLLHQLNTKVGSIMTSLAELPAVLDGIKATLAKALGEITTKIAELEAAVVNANGPLSTDVQNKLDALTAAAAALDGVVPDAAPATVPTADPGLVPLPDELPAP